MAKWRYLKAEAAALFVRKGMPKFTADFSKLNLDCNSLRLGYMHTFV